MSKTVPIGKWPSRGSVYSLFGISIFFLLALVGPIGQWLEVAKHNLDMLQGRQIGQALFSYATNNVQNGNAYPDGNSSTEVFQKLLDRGYVTNPAIFFVSLPGKVKAVAGQKLKPQNVCWNVTSGVDSSSSELVPLVFVTGYRITYAPGDSIAPIIKPYSGFWDKHRTWSQWWNDASAPSDVAIFYKGNNAAFLRLRPDNTFKNAIPAHFHLDGKTYRQLTPEGPLPP